MKTRDSFNTGIVIGENVVFSRKFDMAVENAMEDMITQANRYKNNSLASVNGFVAETYHVGSYNVKSVLSRKNLIAFREKNGNHGDYFIKDMKNGKIVQKGEFKYYSTSAKTENAMRGYGSRKVIGPADQVEEIKKIAKKRELSNKITRPQIAKEHKTVRNNVKDSIGNEDLHSTPKTLKESRRLTRRVQKNKLNSGDVLPEINESVTMAFKSGFMEGAKNGAITTGVISAVSDVSDVVNGKKSVKEAIKHSAVETAKGTLDSAVKSAAGSTAKAVSKSLAEKTSSTLLKKTLNSSVPVAVAVSSVEIAKHAVDFATGKIDGREFSKKSSKSVAVTAGGYAGAELGAVIGTFICPGVGTAIGSFVGGALGSLGVGTLFK